MKRYIKSSRWQDEATEMVLDAYDAAEQANGEEVTSEDVIGKLEDLYYDAVDEYYDLSNPSNYVQLMGDVRYILRENDIWVD